MALKKTMSVFTLTTMTAAAVITAFCSVPELTAICRAVPSKPPISSAASASASSAPADFGIRTG